MTETLIPKTLVIGSSGFLGQYFYRTYQAVNAGAIGTTHRRGPYQLDLTAPSLAQISLDDDYEYGVIAAAKANLSLCEVEKETTYRCNVDGTLEVARQLHQKGIVPILFSSDYVFDGESGGYREEDPLNPLNEYGRQKVALERRIYSVCGPNFLLLRLSKVYGLERGDGTLLDDMASRLILNKPTKIVTDQVFCPIWVGDVVKAVLELQKKKARGVYHLCGETPISRFTIAQRMVAKLSLSENLLRPIFWDDLGEPFKRPKNTSMHCDKLFSIVRMDFQSIDKSIEKIGVQYAATAL